MNLTDNIISIKGIGEKSAECFNKLGIYTIKDLIFYIPKGFDLFEECTSPSAQLNGCKVSLHCYIKPGSYSSIHKGRLNFSHVTFICDNNNIKATYFNMPYLKNQLSSPGEYIIRGILQVSKNGAYSMLQPKLYSIEAYSKLINTLQPLYGLTKGLSNNAISKAVSKVINDIDVDDALGEYEGFNFYHALKSIHFPSDYEDFTRARRRIAYHEFVGFILQMRLDNNTTRNMPFDNPLIETAECGRLLESLPYNLTSAQTKVWNEIKTDMCGDKCMNRMLQGDVGSGKTIISFLALLLNASNNHQGALMAPTEVLAKQHFYKLKELCIKYNLPIRPVLLLGCTPSSQKKAIYDEISNGEANVIIGTHAIFQKDVIYKDLTFVCTDEQHRFGVNQRETLVNKGKNVHLLVMSATPIPRSLAMILYGDISLSIIDELPGGRTPIKNCVVDTSYRPTAYNFIAKEVHNGHQAYIICPMVEEGIDENLENVVDYANKLKDVLPKDIIIGILHGKMKPSLKSEIMDDFADGKIHVLVSTTVIEVGIDVPNSTVMMVENSERFGLASLHQLRGRVGRGSSQSYCIFITGKTDEKTMERLNILKNSNDGFKIADEDLKLRGPGDIFGIRQSGEFSFAIADIYNDSDILKTAGIKVDNILQQSVYEQETICNSMLNTTFNIVDFRTI